MTCCNILIFLPENIKKGFLPDNEKNCTFFPLLLFSQHVLTWFWLICESRSDPITEVFSFILRTTTHTHTHTHTHSCSLCTIFVRVVTMTVCDDGGSVGFGPGLSVTHLRTVLHCLSLFNKKHLYNKLYPPSVSGWFWIQQQLSDTRMSHSMVY